MRNGVAKVTRPSLPPTHCLITLGRCGGGSDGLASEWGKLMEFSNDTGVEGTDKGLPLLLLAQVPAPDFREGEI